MSKISFVSCLLGLFVLSSAQASTFEGRFRVGSCSMSELKDAKRVYSQIGKSRWSPIDRSGKRMNLSSLVFHAYGEDASIMEIYLGKGAVRQAPGTRSRAHGSVPFSWETNKNGNFLYSIEKTLNPGRGIRITEETWVSDNGKRLEIQNDILSSNPGESESSHCELIRY